MSDRSAVTNKGKDGKSKYSSLNLYDTYKGKSVEPQKQAVSHGRGLQSLGKVGNARRVPTPAILPSLRSEHKGNDPNINLVPCSGSGWGADEKKPENAAPSTAPTNPTQQTPQGPAPQDDSQSAKSWHPSAPNAPLQGTQQPQHGTTQALAPAPARSAPPSRLDREFPVLGMSGDQPQPAASSSKDADPEKDKEKSKEVQYGPGPSLRPQNVKSWREGGSSLNKSGGTGTGEGEGAASATGAALDKDRAAMPPPPPPGMAPPGIMNGAQGNAQPPGPMPQFSRMMPAYMQFGPGPGPGPGPRGMPGGPGGPRMPMNPYPMGYPGPPPPRHGFPPHPGAMMPGHPGHDQRPPRHRNKPPMRNREGGGPPPAIVDVKDLSKMEEIAREKTEEGWAGASGEVDYSEKLVFSDEEDDSPKKRAEKGSKHISREPPKEGKDGRLEEDFNRRSPMTTESGPQGLPRAAWEANEKEGGTRPPRGPHPHHGRGPPNMDQTQGPQRPPVDEDDERWNHQRQKQSSEMSSNIERARQRRLEEQKREDERRQAAAKEKLRQLDERSAQTRGPKQEGEDSGSAPVAASSAAPTAAPDAPREVQRADSGHELVQQENHERGEAESSSSRDREWDRDRERHKERDLERERDRAAVEVPFSREGMVIKRQRTESGSSDGSRQGRDRRGDAGNFARQPARNLPPRFLKQQQQQQEQQQQQHRRPPPFSQDQTWHGREGRGSWGGSGSTTPTTPPFGQENRQFTNPNARFHVQRRRESSETSLDGPDRSVFPPEGKDGLREGDVPPGQAAVPSRAEASLPGRGEADDKGNRRGSNDRGFRNQRIPSEGQPKEIPRRQDSHREIPRAPRPDVRPDQRQDHRSDQRQEHRQDHRQDLRQDPKQDRRQDPRHENRPDPRRDNRPDQRWDHRQDQRPEHKPDQKQEQRHEVHQDSKQEPKPAARQELEQEAKQESRPEKKSEVRERPPVDRSISREKVSVTSDENVLDTRQSAPPKCSNEPKAEAPVTHVQEKKEPKETAQPSEKDKKKESGPLSESKENIAEPSKTAKAGSNDRDRSRPQRDSKAVPSSLVDMKSGNREKLERSDKPDRYEKGRRRDGDRDDRSNRRGSQEQSGSRHAPQKQSDSRERRKEDVQAPEPSRAWKGGDTSQRLKLNSPATTIDAHSQQGAAKEAKMDNQPSASRRNNDVSKPHIEEQRPPVESFPKEPRDIQIEKGERKDTEENESGSKPKEVLNDKSRDRSSRDRRDDGRDRGGRTGSRGRGSVDANRRRDDRGPPSRRDERGPPSGTSMRRERGRFDAGSSHGRGFKTYSTGVRGRGRGRGERYDSRQGYRRPRHREDEEEDWDASSGDESADRAQERKEAPRQNKPTEVKDVPEGNGPSTPSEEKPPVSKDKSKEPEAKGETAAAADGPEVDNSERDSPDRRNQVPRGEPSRRGRGASLGRRGRGGSGKGGASRDQGREFYSRDERDSGRPDRPRDGSQRNDRGPRNDWERDGREFRGRGREEDERRMRSDRRDGPPARGDRDPYKGGKRAKPERPPRFQKSPRGGRGTGRVRSARGERMPEASGNRGREPGDQNNQVSGGSPNDVSKGAARPPLPRQNSSDLNNDEWETASESSNFNDHRQRDKEMSQEGPKVGSDKVVRESSSGNPRSGGGNPENRNRNDRRDSGRKGPPNQRQGGDRPNNRDRPDYDRREKSFRGSGRDNRGASSRGGRGRGSDRRQDNGPIGKRPGGPKGGSEHAHNNQNHSSDVYRLDTILLDDQRGVHDALNAVTMRPKKSSMPMGKPLDTTTPVNLPLQTKERERPKQVEKKIDVLATYDINNSYGVVVVDDVPEVIVENPEELLTPDAGFQPVLSRKQKAAESERKKQESLSEINKRSKLGTQMKRNTKLPPRLRGQSPIKEPSTVAPIGTGPRMGTLNKAPGTKPISTDNIPPLIGPGSIIIPPPSLGKSGVESLALAPPPPSNAWDKPPILSGPQPPLVAAAPPAAPMIPASKTGPGVPGKPESSSDQHDSGVELNSDHHASNPPSQRSSPNGEAKAEARLVSELMSAVGQQSTHSPLTSQSDWSTDMAPSSRLSGVGLQSVNEVAVSSYVSASGGMMGRMEGVVTQAKDSGMRSLPVDMVSSSGVIGPNSLLAQSPSGRAGQSSIISSQDQNRSNVQSPTSTAATDELIMKMERTKNLWDEQEEGTPQISLSNGNLSSQALSSMTSVTAGDNDQQLQTQPQQQHISRGDDRGTMCDLGSSHLSHPANSMLPASGTSDITFGSFASSNVELVENDAPTSVSFTSLNANMSANMDADDIDMSVPSSRAYAQFSSANTEVESPPEIFTSAGYSSKGLSLYTSAATGSSFAPGALLQSSILGQSGYETKHYGGEQARMHPQHTQQQSQQQQQQEQSYQQSVLLAQPFNLGSSLGTNLAGSAVGMAGGSLSGNIGGTSQQSMLSQGTSGQYSFQGPDTSRLLPASPAFLNPVSFQGTIIQPQSAGSLQYGLNQNAGMAPASPAPGAASSQQTHQSYQQAAAAGFLPTQTPQSANFAPILSVSLSQQPHVQSHSYLSLSSPSYTRPSHDLGLSAGLSTGLTSSVIMKPQATMGGLTKTVSSVAYGSVSTVPAVQPSHIFSQRATSQLGAQQPGMTTSNTLIAAAMQPSATPAMPQAAYHPTQGQHTSFFSGGAQVAAAANSQVGGSTNFFNTLQGSRTSSLQPSVQAIQPLPIQLPQSTISSQYSMAAQGSQQTTQPIVHPIGAPLGGYVNTYGDIGTQPKQLHRNVPSGFGIERQASSILDMTSDLLSARGSDATISRSSNLSQHVDAKPFSPNRQTNSVSSSYGAYNKPQDDRYGAYNSRASGYKSHEQVFTTKPVSYSAVPLTMGYYSMEDRNVYSQPKTQITSYSQAKATSSYSQPRTTTPTFSQPPAASESPRSSISDSVSLPVSEPAPMSASTASSKQSSLPYSMSTATVTTASATMSQKPIYMQAAQVITSQPPSKPMPATTKGYTVTTTPPAMPQSLPPRGFPGKVGMNTPRMPPQMFGQPTPRMMSHMLGIAGQQMRYPPPFPQGPPPPRGAQFGPPPRLPTAASAGVNLPPSPPNPPTNLQAQKTSQAAPKGQSQRPSSSASQGSTTTQGRPQPSSQSSFQANKSKSMQGLPGPSKLSKAPSHFSKRGPIDLKMTAEELKAARDKDRENLLASTKAFFSKSGSEADPKEKSEKK